MNRYSRGTSGAFGAPRLEVHWQRRRANFFESLRAAFLGPRAARAPDYSASFFRLRLSPSRLPGRGIAGSFAWHLILLSISIPVSQLVEPVSRLPLPEIQITWYGPTTNVAPLVAPAEIKPKPPTKPRPAPKRAVVARAYNPNTTVIFQPPRPTNTRQVLIQPDAPPTTPKFLPSLPNVISWASAARPAISVNPRAVVAERPRPDASLASSEAPQVANLTPPTGPLDIAPDPHSAPKPPVPIAPSAIRVLRPAPAQRLSVPSPVPVAPGADNRLVALSLAPGGNLPPPPGNAAAPISIGPSAGKDAATDVSPAPDIADTGAAPGASMPTAAVPGPEGLVILHENAALATPPRPPISAARLLNRAANSLLARPPRLQPGMLAEDSEAMHRGGVFPHDLAHEVLGYRPIHKLLINMPDLTSATGSWVLDFAALPGEEVPVAGDVVAPLPMVKVDPKYPPVLVEEKVEGEVVLYAVIGRDGAVNQIRVVKSLDPRLDENAEAAFAQWKFRPALIDNRQVGLEVLVHIPFRISLPR
ncbi:MAG TPA: TonB family protein [Candidatus Acidoferrales bacterium]|nr:TonB family protein [Candidatus Acidoferrales bacterium]